eukprot:7811431-Pyramimonas_sp.AAC.1
MAREQTRPSNLKLIVVVTTDGDVGDDVVAVVVIGGQGHILRLKTFPLERHKVRTPGKRGTSIEQTKQQNIRWPARCELCGAVNYLLNLKLSSSLLVQTSRPPTVNLVARPLKTVT